MGRVLIVDDDSMTVELLCKIVRVHGHEPLRAFSGREALEQVAKDKPDAILLDLMMPEMDGFEVLRRLRAMPDSDGLPVLVVTASAERDIEARVAEAGADGCLRKPVDFGELAEWVNQLVAGDRQSGEPPF
jgi:CheY-like chemotaxis protein